MKHQDIKLKVVEALQDDAYKGIARIDPQIMKVLGLARGDIVIVKGGRETVAIVDRAYPADGQLQKYRLHQHSRESWFTAILRCSRMDCWDALL